MSGRWGARQGARRRPAWNRLGSRNCLRNGHRQDRADDDPASGPAGGGERQRLLDGGCGGLTPTRQRCSGALTRPFQVITGALGSTLWGADGPAARGRLLFSLRQRRFRKLPWAGPSWGREEPRADPQTQVISPNLTRNGPHPEVDTHRTKSPSSLHFCALCPEGCKAS